MILFLDYDGVLHPDAVYLRLSGQIELRAPGHLFMRAPALVDALAANTNTRIVLSTSWVRHLGFRAARKALPAALQSRVIGATWHSAMARDWPIQWDCQTRYEQIATYLSRLNEPSPWLAIDDDASGWPNNLRDRLVQTDPLSGLSEQGAIAEVRDRLLTERRLSIDH